VLPRLERYLNPAVREVLAETADVARAEEQYWTSELGRLVPALWQAHTRGGTLDLGALLRLPLALQRRVVKALASSLKIQLDFHHVDSVLKLAENPSVESATLPHGWTVLSRHDCLEFSRADQEQAAGAYEYCLCVPGEVSVPELHSTFRATVITHAISKDESVYARELLHPNLVVRNWRPGDRFWPAHHKAPIKLKELLQKKHIRGEHRTSWPVIVSGAEIIWVRSFPPPARFAPNPRTTTIVSLSEISDHSPVAPNPVPDDLSEPK
jgi:tRNA(Ile)-lysidine synthase